MPARCAPGSCSSRRSSAVSRQTLSLLLGLYAGTWLAPGEALGQSPALEPVAAAHATLSDDAPASPAVQLTAQQEEDDGANVPPAAQEAPGGSAAPQSPPEIPETFVPGRAGVFPANPLPDDAAITPTRTPTRIGGTGTALTVITREEIERSGQSSLVEVLRGKPGLDVVRSGGPGGQTSVFLRGANSQHTKVLLDGIPINDPSNATRGLDFSTLDVENIERIEILRGPQSLLYGSDAIGGVINIITRRGEGPMQVRSRHYGGSLGTWRTGMSVSGGDERTYYSFGGSYLATDGISQASADRGNTERDRFRNGTLSGRFGWTPSDQVNVDYVFRYQDADAGIDNFDLFTGVPVDNIGRKNLLNSFYNRVQLQSLFLDGGIEQVVGFNVADYHRKDTDPEPGVPPLFKGQARQIDYQLNFLLTEWNTLSAGAQYYAENAASTFNPEESQYNRGVFLQDQWQIFENWFASVGVRFDDHSRAGPAETYRATSVYTFVATNTDLHGSIGTGFRAPALAENLFAFGNPNLRPERSKGWDFGITQRLLDNRLTVDATYFRNDFEDLIVFDFNTFSLENIGRARASGVEITGRWDVLENTAVWANYTLTDTLDYSTNLPLVRRPRDKVTIGLDQYFWARTARIGGEAMLVGDRLDTGQQVLDEYAVINLNGSYYFGPNTELFARIDNVFNEKYEEIRGFGSVGITGYAGFNLLW